MGDAESPEALNTLGEIWATDNRPERRKINIEWTVVLARGVALLGRKSGRFEPTTNFLEADN